MESAAAIEAVAEQNRGTLGSGDPIRIFQYIKNEAELLLVFVLQILSNSLFLTLGQFTDQFYAFIHSI